jgi:Predicted GTPase, probable translation factor
MNFLIMGLPKSGKSALFNTLTKSTRQDMYSDVRIGTVKVPDKNLDKVSKWHDTEKKVNGEIDITDPATNLNFDSSSDFIEKNIYKKFKNMMG